MTSDQLKLPLNAHDNLQIAIETTGMSGSLAVLRGETVLRDWNLEPGRRTAALLAPALAELLRWCRDTQNQPQLVSIANGPGSFTGLRIGVTTAKTLGYASDLPVIPVDSLASIAAVSLLQQPEIENILVAIDAYRGQVFKASFQRKQLLMPLGQISSAVSSDREARPLTGVWSPHPEQIEIVDADQWKQVLAATGEGEAVTGDRKVFGQRTDLRFIERKFADAIGVGLLAARASMLGLWCDPLQLTPRYLRPSAAEEKANQKS